MVPFVIWYVQGEIDVVGVNLKTNEAYICESSTHLTTGLLYVGKDNKNNNIQKLVLKNRLSLLGRRELGDIFNKRWDS